MARKQKPWDSAEFLNKEYQQNNKSTSEIAKEQGTYPMTIRRALIKHGFKIRNKSAAQKNNLEKNGSPLTGRKRTHEEKIKISMGHQSRWKNMTNEERNKDRMARSEIGKNAWLGKTEKEKKDAIASMRIGNSRKTRAGSKNENLVADMLINIGYRVVQRSKDYAPGRQYEIDIAIPKLRIAIEWDGPNHFDPIYGLESLAKVKAKDKIKNNTLVGVGWTVVRVRDHSTSSTMAFCRRAVDEIIDVIENGKKKVVHIIDAE